MSIATHIEILELGTEAWNEWRAAHPDVQPQLEDVDLSDADLVGANLAEANLGKADLFEAKLERANLKMATLSGADLSGAKMAGAALYKADLSGASLMGADLTGADLREANLSGADLRGADLTESQIEDSDLRAVNLSEAKLTGTTLSRSNLTGANLCHSDLTRAELIGLQYGSFRSLKGHCRGIRGLDSCFGNALFVRDAKDQDYLDSLEHDISQTASPWYRRWRSFWFKAWGLIDYGRSLARAGLYALLMASTFAVIYFLDMVFAWGLIDYSSSAQSWFSPFYYSIVTYSTLGFGDITPSHWVGEIIVVTEVLLGYVTLGLLLSILATKVARRS